MRRRALGVGVVVWLVSLTAHPVCAQVSLAVERAEYLRWLASSPTSPLAAVALQPIGTGLRLGPADADVPLPGAGGYRVLTRPGGVRLEGPSGSRILPRGAPVKLGDYTLAVDGPAGREVLTVFGPSRPSTSTRYYGPSWSYVFVGPLAPPDRQGTSRVLGMDGIEVEAAEAGSVLVPIGAARVRLRVLRMPLPGGEESELEIFFRDETNGHGTYPAGRFVSLVPTGAGRYRLDFNRARNPYCAYSSAYPCPAPWRGNTIPAAVTAGERYDGGGLSAPPRTPGTR
ncbi:MAG: DUF1684 domain-containing protein [Gemmatimonadales bacterium]